MHKITEKKIKSFYLRGPFTSVYLRHSPFSIYVYGLDLNIQSAFLCTQLCPDLDNTYGISLILTDSVKQGTMGLFEQKY